MFMRVVGMFGLSSIQFVFFWNKQPKPTANVVVFCVKESLVLLIGMLGGKITLNMRLLSKETAGKRFFYKAKREC